MGILRSLQQSVPARVGLLGNPSDLYGGQVIGFALADFCATVKLREMEVLNSFESSVKEMSAALNSYSLFFASSFVGKEVLYQGNQTLVREGKGKATFALSSPAQEVTVTVTDSEGNVVERKSFYNLESGSYPFEIDNASLKDGYYTVSVSAKAYDGSPVEVKVESYALVNGVRKDEEGKLYAVTELFEIPAENIMAIGG
jgi:flagellar basal-body rod modification protein FlgD